MGPLQGKAGLQENGIMQNGMEEKVEESEYETHGTQSAHVLTQQRGLHSSDHDGGVTELSMPSCQSTW